MQSLLQRQSPPLNTLLLQDGLVQQIVPAGSFEGQVPLVTVSSASALADGQTVTWSERTEGEGGTLMTHRLGYLRPCMAG